MLNQCPGDYTAKTVEFQQRREHKRVERRGRDSNPRWRLSPHTRLAGECLQPLGHLSRGGRGERPDLRGQCKGWAAGPVIRMRSYDVRPDGA
jgi:hypothetical protein